MQLVIVESPAKAKTIEKYLGPGFKVLASYGHVRDLPPKDGSVRPEEDFAMDWELYRDKQSRFKEIADSAKGAERLEVGGHQYALLAGLTSSIDFLAGLDDRARGTRRERLEISITSLQDYHDQLFEHLMRLRPPLVNDAGAEELADRLMEQARASHDKLMQV